MPALRLAPPTLIPIACPACKIREPKYVIEWTSGVSILCCWRCLKIIVWSLRNRARPSTRALASVLRDIGETAKNTQREATRPVIVRMVNQGLRSNGYDPV